MAINITRVVLIGGLLTALPAWGVYAPIPEQEQGKEWTVTLRAGIFHDSNIFGAQNGAISSMVYEVAPKVAFNASLTDQTFASAYYALVVDHFDNRPGDKTLASHDLFARVDQTFSPVTSLHVSDSYVIARNPESLLAGVTLNTDQSYKRNEFDARFETNLAPQFGTMPKFQSVNYNYDDANLSTSLDHTENLFGLSVGYTLLPELRALAEARHQDILYRTGGGNKDKHSNFVIAGADYVVAQRLTATARLGYEWRHREGEQSTDAPYVEGSLKYEYAQRSFISAGYVYTLEETSNVALYTDTKVNRFFANVQHALSAFIVASGSITYEPSELQGRRGLPDADETTTRFGLALTYIPTKNWRFSATYDYDNVESDDPARGQNRARTGVNGTFTF